MTISLDIQDNIAVITMDDGKANACSLAVLEDLEGKLDEAEGSADALVLTGRDGVFSGGFDLGTVRSGDQAAIFAMISKGVQVGRQLYGYKKPVVIAAGGHAMALGAIMLLCGDTRIGAKGDYKFGLNETAIGMTIPAFGVAVAEMRLDRHQLTRSIVQAHVYDAAGAVEAGFLDRLAPADKLMDEAMTEARALAALDTVAYHGNKMLVRERAMAVRDMWDEPAG